MLTAYEIPNLQFSLPCITSVDRRKFVSVDANGNAIQATDTTPVIGVSRNIIDPAIEPDNQVLSIANGIMPVEADGVIACGAYVKSSATGFATTAADPTTETVVGVALTPAAAAGEIVTVKLNI